MAQFTALTRDERTNAALAWVLIGLLVFDAIGSLRTGDVLWAGLTLLVVAVAVVPPLAVRAWTVMVPWPVVALGVAAAAVQSFGIHSEAAGYLAVATLALLAVVELDALTSVEMSRRFAVGFAALTTLAVQGWWIVAQYASDRWLGTTFLRSQRELQWDIVLVTGVGVAVAACFQWYFDRTGHVGSAKRPAVTTDDAN
ncbi:hypothetical protein [Haloarcula laminariae]|uniref:hypothetical protein n=1 Tax=Haloarcula laminariae TaxID=2961577 RepID=UPI0024072FAF|nr:hypothetical protein [Halomicroarcula sp. FL173]